MSGLKSKRKGNSNERNFVNRWRERGYGASRMPLSGALGSVAGMDLSGDVKLFSHWSDWRVECKVRANGFRELYKWLSPQNIDFLSLKANNQPPLIVMTEDTLAEIMGEADQT